MDGNTLLANVLSYFWDSCREYYEHKKREPKQPAEKRPGIFNQHDLEREWAQYDRVHGRWEIDHFLNGVNLQKAAMLIKGSAFSTAEKTEIVDRLHLLARHHKDDEVIMQHLANICQSQGLPDFTPMHTA
jgi:hypothetical protein